MIRKNAESGPEQIGDLRRELMRSHIATFQRQIEQGDVFWDVAGPVTSTGESLAGIRPAVTASRFSRRCPTVGKDQFQAIDAF